MLWFSNVNKYVWSRERTPYFTAPEDMTEVQARHELFAYTILLGSVFAIVALGGLIASLRDPALPQVLWLLCGSIVLWACVGLVRTRDPLAAWTVALAPAAILVQTIQSAIQAGALGPDRILIMGVVLVLLRYGWRVVRIARCHRVVRGAEQGAEQGAARAAVDETASDDAPTKE